MVDKKGEGIRNNQEQKEEIEKRLKRILTSDLENGHEKVTLFMSRYSFREFPKLGFRGDFNHFRIENEIEERARYLFVIWRALLISWEYNQKNKFKNEFLAIPNSSETAFGALGPIYSAFSILYHHSPVEVIDKLPFPIELNIATVIDLNFLEGNTNNCSVLRQKPLWHNEEDFNKSSIADIYKNQWPTAINSLLEQKEIANNPRIKNQILKIQTDYDAILHGYYKDQNDNDKKVEVKYNPEDKNKHETLADDDFLGRKRLMDSLLRRLRVVDDHGHLTIGLFGDWGAGKSNFIKLLKKELDNTGAEKEDVRKMEFIYGEFNAWAYEHTDNIQAGMTQEMMNALTKFQSASYRKMSERSFNTLTWAEKVKLCGSVGWSFFWFVVKKPWLVVCSAVALHHIRFINYFMLIMIGLMFGENIAAFIAPYSKELGNLGIGVAGAGTLAGIWFLFKELKAVGAQPFATELKTYLRLPTYGKHLGMIPVMAKQIKTLCHLRLGKRGFFGKSGPFRKKHRRLLFVVDDLDRCGVDGIVKTFEAIRLILELDNVIVVIAVDQRIALPALACHYERLSAHHKHDAKNIARDYLAKVINLPLHLPPPDDASVALYLAHLWDNPSFTPPDLPIDGVEDVVEEGQLDDQVQEYPEADVAHAAEESEETLDDILRDIAKIDVSAVLNEGKGNTSTVESKGLSPEQKNAFYYWLIQLNLRNPRQIKRLYNSYNLLQHYHKEDIALGGIEYGFPFMVALFLIERMNQEIIGNGNQKSRQELIDYIFNNGEEHDFIKLTVSKKILKKARELLLKNNDASLFEKIEPFVLPVAQMDEQ